MPIRIGRRILAARRPESATGNVARGNKRQAKTMDSPLGKCQDRWPQILFPLWPLPDIAIATPAACDYRWDQMRQIPVSFRDCSCGMLRLPASLSDKRIAQRPDSLRDPLHLGKFAPTELA